MSDCADPTFRWDETHGHYQACSTCGRLAWDHEQANPRADLTAHADWIRDGSHGPPPPPHMIEETG